MVPTGTLGWHSEGSSPPESWRQGGADPLSWTLFNVGIEGGSRCPVVALHFMFYNFGRIHQTLRVTPAMEAGLTDHVWSLEELAALTDEVVIA